MKPETMAASCFPLNSAQQEWHARAVALVKDEIAPRAAEVDRHAQYPVESLAALRREGFFSMRVAVLHGGAEADLLSVCLVIEEIAKHCASTAMCFKMHLEATELLNRIATQDQVERFVQPLLRGEMLATVAGSETAGATGSDWRPSLLDMSQLKRVDGGYALEGLRKSYVTSAGHATHYLLAARLEGRPPELGPEMIFVERAGVETEVLGEWTGLGLRGNGSSPMRFSGTVPEANRIGIGHEGEPYMVRHMMPLVVLTYGAAYLGIASGAFELACREGSRRHDSGASRLDSAINQRRLAEASVRIEAARALLHAAAFMVDQGRYTIPLPLIQAKIACAEAAVAVTQEFMTLFGGTAYAGRLPFERYLRDARAAPIMGYANDQAYEAVYGMLLPPQRNPG